jgi:hypothetical protein
LAALKTGVRREATGRIGRSRELLPFGIGVLIAERACPDQSRFNLAVSSRFRQALVAQRSLKGGLHLHFTELRHGKVEMGQCFRLFLGILIKEELGEM